MKNNLRESKEGNGGPLLDPMKTIKEHAAAIENLEKRPLTDIGKMESVSKDDWLIAKDALQELLKKVDYEIAQGYH